MELLPISMPGPLNKYGNGTKTTRRRLLRVNRPDMFSEDIVLGGLKAGSSWFISDHLLRMDAPSGNAEHVARLIADRNDLICLRDEVDGKPGFRFWRIEHRGARVRYLYGQDG